ncbi:MAG TPA: hypothetical protein VFJ06_05335 [Halococcus sp.]|nr:hypothetical protein [Halococcus sp.]
MGVFDRIEVDKMIGERLPNYDANRLGTAAHEAEWQTKSLDQPTMRRYRITAAGTLEKYNRETEPVPEDEWTAEQRDHALNRAASDHPLSGGEYQPTRTTDEWWERLPDWHGSFSFYSSFDVGTDTPERWEYDAQLVHGTLSRIVQTKPVPADDGIADFEFASDDTDMQSTRDVDHTPSTRYADELIDDEGKSRCPATGCSWWVPHGMEYLYDVHRIQHVQLLSGEMDVDPTSAGYSGPVDIEVWGTLTENADPGTITIDVWDSPDDEHASVELRIEQTYARELGVRLIEAAGHAREIE